MRVLKFGGTSVADAGAIARLVSIVDGRKGARTVVVSALGGVIPPMPKRNTSVIGFAASSRKKNSALSPK